MQIDGHFNYIIASYAIALGVLAVISLKVIFSYYRQKKNNETKA